MFFPLRTDSTNCVITIIIITLLPKNMNQIQFVQKESPLGSATESAHPGESPQPSCGFVRNLFELLKTNWVVVLIAARFSPDDKYSKERVLLKKRFGLLPIQGAPVKYWKGLASLVFFFSDLLLLLAMLSINEIMKPSL